MLSSRLAKLLFVLSVCTLGAQAQKESAVNSDTATKGSKGTKTRGSGNSVWSKEETDKQVDYFEKIIAGFEKDGNEAAAEKARK